MLVTPAFDEVEQYGGRIRFDDDRSLLESTRLSFRSTKGPVKMHTLPDSRSLNAFGAFRAAGRMG